jgi:hypothetical protein
MDASRWLPARCPDLGDRLVLVGKTLRGSRDGAAPGIHLLAAYALTWPTAAPKSGSMARPTNSRRPRN